MFVFGTAKVSQPNIVPKAFHLPGVADLRAWLVLLILSRKSSVGWSKHITDATSCSIRKDVLEVT